MKTNNTSKRKTDKRTICTKTAIKEVLLEMLKETPFSKISVKELCERIDINRTTFYIHYGNTLDVLIEIIDELLLAEVDEKQSKCNVDNSNYHCPYKLCCKIHTDRKYGVVFFNDDLKNIIIDRITVLNKEGYLRALMTQYNINKSDSESIFFFLINGCLAVNKMVFNRGSGDWEHTSEVIGSFVRGGLNHFLR
ncbi:MAG: TetR/AcrR family transcriptional regulator [Candidatus Methanomethylophilaceae archaeon]|nr:TetR/AcrR family transcriptional regulator [Candidatus Methanomethylophilaceae archaeon]